MSAFDDIRELESFHECRDEVIPRKIVGKVLEAGRHAPSPGNVQSLEFVVVEDEDRKDQLYRITGDERLNDAPTSVIVISDFDRMERRIDGDVLESCSAEAGCAVQNMRIVAQQQGLATSWISGFEEGQVEETFDIPHGKKAMGVVMMAYTDHPVPLESRFDLNEVCYYDVYDNQVESFWDHPGWRGLREESEIHGKKAQGLLTRIRRGLDNIL